MKMPPPNGLEKIPFIDFIEQRLKSDPVARKILAMDETATRELDTSPTAAAPTLKPTVTLTLRTVRRRNAAGVQDVPHIGPGAADARSARQLRRPLAAAAVGRVDFDACRKLAAGFVRGSGQGDVRWRASVRLVRENRRGAQEREEAGRAGAVRENRALL